MDAATCAGAEVGTGAISFVMNDFPTVAYYLPEKSARRDLINGVS